MPIPIPDLDDRNYDQLYKEITGLITRYFPDFTNIGPSDPAMTLNELYCYIFANASSQINQITAETRLNFGVLLGIDKVYGRPPEEAQKLALAALAGIDRAITAKDIITIIKKTSGDPLAGYSEPVTRAFVLPGEQVKVFVVQKGAVTGGITAGHKGDLRRLYTCLRKTCPIGARFLLQHAPVLNFDLTAEISKYRDSTIPESNLISEVKNTLNNFFDPLKGGSTGTGWEFGRTISRSEIYSLLEGIKGIDHLKSLRIKASLDPNYTGADELQPPVGGLVKLKSLSVTVK